ncbi:hypothetical protein GCM10007036_10330 [Alsobacter metallidurans]|uniref:Response regulatory domain-containing protein n=1 Tax=Alsobacter metallidurans TaxID=340221 RepID=A0A917I579_9HYPH|nr:response regulator [Alsobacter metallidurans]GGH12483.1 hypothetical protein GCM10007036_10330 [Alsobacter metallidurans]
MYKVILVEDDLFGAFVIKDLLEGSGYIVRHESDGLAALLHFEDEDQLPDIVVSDMHLAGEMTGAELALEVRAICPSLPIILISGADFPSSALPPGVPFLPKPLCEGLFLALVRQLLAGVRACGSPARCTS